MAALKIVSEKHKKLPGGNPEAFASGSAFCAVRHWCLCGLIVCICFMSCSVMLPGAMQAYNTVVPEQTDVTTVDKLVRIDKRCKINIRCKNGEEKTGRGIELKELGDDDYAGIFNLFLNTQPDEGLPRLHETVAVRDSHGEAVDSEFLGFDLGPAVVVEQNGRRQRVDFKDVDGVSFERLAGKLSRPAVLADIGLPVYTVLRCRIEGQYTLVPLHEIESVEVIYERKPTRPFFIAGLIIDMALIYGLMQVAGVHSLN